MKLLILIFGVVTALCLRAGVTAMEDFQEPTGESQNSAETALDDVLPYVYETEEGPMSVRDVRQLKYLSYDRTYHEKTRGMIRQLLDASDADILDQEGFRSEVACYSQNVDGSVFRAFGNNARRTQNRAINKCFYHRSVCEPLGCVSR